MVRCPTHLLEAPLQKVFQRACAHRHLWSVALRRPLHVLPLWAPLYASLALPLLRRLSISEPTAQPSRAEPGRAESRAEQDRSSTPSSLLVAFVLRCWTIRSAVFCSRTHRASAAIDRALETEPAGGGKDKDVQRAVRTATATGGAKHHREEHEAASDRTRLSAAPSANSATNDRSIEQWPVMGRHAESLPQMRPRMPLNSPPPRSAPAHRLKDACSKNATGMLMRALVVCSKPSPSTRHSLAMHTPAGKSSAQQQRPRHTPGASPSLAHSAAASPSPVAPAVPSLTFSASKHVRSMRAQKAAGTKHAHSRTLFKPALASPFNMPWNPLSLEQSLQAIKVLQQSVPL